MKQVTLNSCKSLQIYNDNILLHISHISCPRTRQGNLQNTGLFFVICVGLLKQWLRKYSTVEVAQWESWCWAASEASITGHLEQALRSYDPAFFNTVEGEMCVSVPLKAGEVPGVPEFLENLVESWKIDDYI